MDQYYPGPAESLLFGNLPDLFNMGNALSPSPVFLQRMHGVHGKVFRFFAGPLWQGPSALVLAFLDPVDCRQLFERAPDRVDASFGLAGFLTRDGALFPRGCDVARRRALYASAVASPEAVGLLRRVATDACDDAVVAGVDSDFTQTAHTLVFNCLYAWLIARPAAAPMFRSLFDSAARDAAQWKGRRVEPVWDSAFRAHKAKVAQLRTFVAALMQQAAPPGDASALGVLARDGGQDADALLGLFEAALAPTRAALAWLFHLLAANADAQRALAAELAASAAPGDDGESLLRASVLESLRVRPAVPAVARQSDVRGVHVGQPYTFEDSGFFGEAWLPARTPAFASLFAAGRLARFFGPHPGDFCPQRFLTQDAAGQSARASSMPFGGGERACVGADAAVALLESIAARVLLRFSVEPDGGDGALQGAFADGLLVPEAPVRLVFKPRAR